MPNVVEELLCSDDVTPGDIRDDDGASPWVVVDVLLPIVSLLSVLLVAIVIY